MQESSVYRSIKTEGRVEEQQEIAINALREGLTSEVVARLTRLSVEEVQQLQQLAESPISETN